MSANGIAHLATRELRQKAKLDLAAAKRQADAGNRDPNNADNRHTYDLTELPTQYSGNDIVDNPNPSGLILGRPWTDAPAFDLPAGMSLHEPLEGSGGTDPTVPGTLYLTASGSGINAGFGTRGTPYNPGGNVSSVPNNTSGIYREKYIGNIWSTYGAFSEFDITWLMLPHVVQLV
jgi:hypothetical protein